MTIFERIRFLRKQQKMSQQELAYKVGYKDKSAISKVELGDREINQAMIVKYADALGVSPTYIMFGETSTFDHQSIPSARPIVRKRLPMLGNVACGEPIFAQESHESYVDADSDTDADFCLTAKGDSMINARIFDGDVLFVKSQPTVENGEIAVVLIEDEATVKRVYYDKENNVITLAPENPLYKPLRYEGPALDQIRILGKVVSGQYKI